MDACMDLSIKTLAHRIADVLDRNVHSIWLYGSVVLNDFRLGWSDIDFIAITKAPITERQANTLLMLRQTLSSQFPQSPYYRLFEGVIVHLKEYRSNQYTRLVYWGTTGQRITSQCEIDAFARYELARYGRVVYGDEDCELFITPKTEEMLTAIQGHYEAIRRYAVQTNESLYSCGWLLDLARCVYFLRHNDVISKTQAGLWALDAHVFSDEESLKRALDIRQNPLDNKDRAGVKRWLRGLGPTVQQYADVLEQELKRVRR